MYFTPIRLELLLRSGTNQIVAYKVVSFVCQVWDSALFVFFHAVGFQSRISRMSSTGVCLWGKEQEINLAGAILRIRKCLKQKICPPIAVITRSFWVGYLIIYCVKMARNVCISWNRQAQDPKKKKERERKIKEKKVFHGRKVNWSWVILVRSESAKY